VALVAEVCQRSLNKRGQELCGDWVKVDRDGSSLLVVLSDGLGSGVKANILATLTTEIIRTMHRAGASLEEMVETVATSLPVCRVRGIAYATFTVVEVENDRAYLAEYDNPGLFLVRNGRLVDLQKTERVLHERTIQEARFALQEGDYLVCVSDGCLHAGIGGLLNLGWGWPAVGRFICGLAAQKVDAYVLAMALVAKCHDLYQGEPGDDATVVAMRVRQANHLTVLTGPPADRERDVAFVAAFMAAPGAKLICGGTTANIVARVLGKKVEPRLDSGKAGPPTAWLPGVGLATEGIVTLHRVLQLVRGVEFARELAPSNDGPTDVARALLNADSIRLMVGDAVNPMQVADVIQGQAFRQVLVEELTTELRRRGKVVEVEHY
jgi:hypothetical protein